MLWNSSTDCCSWNGVTCNISTGHVTGLDLSDESISGIDNSSTLFKLRHLQSLNLAYNTFDSTTIPTELSQLTSLTHLNLSNSSYNGNTLAYGQCLDDQKTLLLQLKHNLSFAPPAATSTLTSWGSNTDCCLSWDGIKCDANGHVISVDLNSQSISVLGNWSSLLELKYLTSLNLSYNSFNSTIPSGLDRLANLTHLNLSNSGFAGQIPVEISRMKRLVSLDLSTLFVAKKALKLENPDLRTLFKDLSELRELYLDAVNISMHGIKWSEALSSALPKLEVLSLSNCNLSGPLNSSLFNLHSLSTLRLDGNNISAQVPDFFGNFSKLTLLHLSDCGLLGNFPEKIFQLPLLRSLDLSINLNLQGFLPEFPQNGSLENLVLTNTKFPQKLPGSIGNLRFLSKLELAYCGFSGPIPTSVSNLIRLQNLDLSSNNFIGAVPNLSLSENLTQVNIAHNRLNGTMSSSQWGRNLKLVTLTLQNNSLSGGIPSSLFSLPLLQKLDLSQNQFSGQLGEFSNVSSLMLDTLDFSNNMLGGVIPSSIFNVSTLKIIALSSNNLTGTLQLDRFQNFRNLDSLDLSGNNISINSNGTDAALFPQVGTLKLASCNLSTFPEFLSNQSTLSHLDLSNNQIRGKIPNWIWKIGNGSLAHLNLSFNLLENPDQPFPGGHFYWLAVIDLHSNWLQGMPILPPSASVLLDYSKNNITFIPKDIGLYLSGTLFFSLSHNSLTGEIPSSICYAEYLLVLDLSSNSLSGSVPTCLGGISMLRVLNLRSNKLTGTITEEFPKGCSLRTLDLNGNKLQGEVSKSLANCRGLEVLDLGNNQINGPFPRWLGELSHLRVLVLRSNKFNGSISYPETSTTFQMLQIIDLSSNSFTGNLPSEFFLRWKGMMSAEAAENHNILRFGFLELSRLYYQDAVTATIKGRQMELVKILNIFTSIDMSNNSFEGEIPETIGNLTSLYVLNLSCNALTGSIPPSLGNLKQLESLDLSANKLNGGIPLQLTDITFLSVLNLSFNQLAGKIPQDRQFQTFNENVFEGNNELCGPPLSKTCADDVNRTTSTNELCNFSWFKNCADGSNPNWQLILLAALGYGVGIGMAICLLVFSRTWNQLCNAVSKRILKMDSRRILAF